MAEQIGVRTREADIMPGVMDPTESRAAAFDPRPLGLGMFGITTFVLSVINAHLVDTGGAAHVDATWGKVVAPTFPLGRSGTIRALPARYQPS